MKVLASNDSIKLKIIEIDHIVIRCKDTERQIKFYIDILGLEPYRLEEFRAGKVEFPSARVNKNTILDLFPYSNQEPVGDGRRNLDHFCFTIEPTDLEQLANQLRECGVTVEEGSLKVRAGAEGMGRSMYLRDFEGNKVEVRHY